MTNPQINYWQKLRVLLGEQSIARLQGYTGKRVIIFSKLTTAKKVMPLLRGEVA